jgi:D-alanine-D-alanine ligase
MKIPYTGSSYEATFVTSNKTVAKKIMRYHGIPTPASITAKRLNEIKPGSRYIVKPIWEDGSLYLDEASVMDGITLREKAESLDFQRFFIEEYIDGREFNISILTSENGPVVLNPAEIVFTNYAPEKPKIVGYTAKWDTDSFEYKNTVREFPELKPDLQTALKKICIDCWEAFKIKGYARVDIRLDATGNPFVLEVNPNPCISPDSGFIAALHQTGMGVDMAIANIVNDLN